MPPLAVKVLLCPTHIENEFTVIVGIVLAVNVIIVLVVQAFTSFDEMVSYHLLN